MTVLSRAERPRALRDRLRRPAPSTTIALIVASILFMQNLDSAIIATSLPQMATAFGVRPVDLSVGITAYILAAAACVPASFWLAERLGAWRVLALAVVVFTLASLACGAADSLPIFVLARVVQGCGGALMAPVGQSLLLRHTEKPALMRAMSLVTWPSLMAPVLGPVLGGFITTYSNWRWNFLLNGPLGLIGLFLVLRFIPRERSARPPRLDGTGLVLSASALVLLLEGLDRLTGDLAHPAWPLAFMALGSAGLALTVWHLRRHPTPLIDLSPLRLQSFAVTCLTSGAVFRAIFSATPFLLPLLFQLGFHINAAGAGSLVLIYFAGNLLMKTRTTATLRRFGFRSVLIVSGGLAGASVAACGALRPGLPLALIGMVLFIAGAARSMHLTSVNTLAYADLEPTQKSSASTLLNVLQQTAMAVGVALAALLLSAVARARGASSVGLAEFQIVLPLIGATAVAAAWHYRRLPAAAGAEVSGHKS